MPKNTYPETIYYYDHSMTSIISLKPEFKVERKAMRKLASTDSPNQYITREQQDQYVIRLEDGYFTDATNESLHGEYNFVFTCEENPLLLCSKTLHHSWLANGKKVLGAGTLIFDQGQLEIITNNSGHYRPTNDEILPVIQALHTASNETLISYRSFCNKVVANYPVIELLANNNFDLVNPILSHENIHPNSGIRITTDYENSAFYDPEDYRYGRYLNQELNNITVFS